MPRASKFAMLVQNALNRSQFRRDGDRFQRGGLRRDFRRFRFRFRLGTVTRDKPPAFIPIGRAGFWCLRLRVRFRRNLVIRRRQRRA